MRRKRPFYTCKDRHASSRLLAIPALAIALCAAPAHALILDLTPDPSVGSAPAGFLPALQFAAGTLEKAYADPITVNVTVGWGEINGVPLSPGDIGQSSARQLGSLTYARVRAALIADTKTGYDLQANSTLPAADPTSGRTFRMADAEAKALGLLAASGTGADGAVGFASNVRWTFDPNNRAVAGAYDFTGVALHELTEVMGRYGIGQNGCSDPLCDSPIDLFRFEAPGTLAQTKTNGTYFSIDGGTTNINTYDGATGDFSDWLGTTLDAFNSASSLGRLEPLTAGDMILMDVIGYDLVQPVSEPATIALVGAWFAGLAAGRCKRPRRPASFPRGRHSA